jgi:hypothetical protein
MSNGTGRYMFAGHALGASARFHRLDEQENLNHVVPALGAAVVPPAGGRSGAHADVYQYHADSPRRRCLFEVQRVDTFADGRDAKGLIETEVSAEVTGLHVVEKLRCDLVRMHMVATRKGPTGDPVITTKGNRIDGMRLLNVEAVVTIDDEPLLNSRDAEQFEACLRGKGLAAGRLGSYSTSTIVREIRLVGSEKDKQGMSVDGNVIVWKGFGRIILGEIHVKAHDRRLTLVRLAMGSDAGGTGTAGDGHTNGQGDGG